MGGSLAARVRKRFPGTRVIGISRSRQAIRTALKKGWIHKGSDQLNAAGRADFVVLCTPLDTFAKFLLSLEKICRPGTIVTDVGSVKAEITRWAARRRFRNIEFSGAHPMAGSHARGIQAAHETLYDHSLTFVVQSGASPAAFAAVKKFWKKITPRIAVVKPEEHDRIVGRISHLPHALAACLVLTPEERDLRFAAAGFSDTTRIAAGDPSVWIPIFGANRKEILFSLKKFEIQLSNLRKTLEKTGGPKLFQFLEKAKRRRAALSL